MKKKLILLISLVFIFTGCETLSKLTQFDMNFNQSVTIPSSSLINVPFDLATPAISTNSASTFSGNNTNPDLVDKISLKKMKLTVTSPTTGDFGFLKSIDIYINAEGLKETKLAWLNDVPATAGSTLELNVSQANLKDFILKDKFSLRVAATTDETHNSDYDVDVSSVFLVDAKILGL